MLNEPVVLAMFHLIILCSPSLMMWPVFRVMALLAGLSITRYAPCERLIFAPFTISRACACAIFAKLRRRILRTLIRIKEDFKLSMVCVGYELRLLLIIE